MHSENKDLEIVVGLVQSVFLQLVRLGIGTSKDAKIPNGIDWKALKALADEHGLSAIVLDGLNEVRSKKSDERSDWFPPQTMTLEWIGEVMQNYEARYKQYKKAVSSLAGCYNQHGFKMMALKGYACSLDWPKPNHRPCGDIDIWQFGQYREADSTLVSEKNIKIDSSHHHHTVFYWQDFMVENHYDFINVHHHKSNAAFEAILKEQGKDDSQYVMVNGEKVYLPSPNLHALFLLKHACIEFAASGLNMRQVLDWAFFVEKHGKEVDWGWLMKVLEEFGMKTMFNAINGVCVENLGFSSSIFPNVQCYQVIKERVLNEILFPNISNDKPKRLLSRILWKYKRWKANEWKHKLCYNQSMWSAFCSGIWSHLLKPSSI